MTIRILTGAPGSGKTFYAVKHIKDNYAFYDRNRRKWKIKSQNTIITNIEELRLEHIDFDDAIQKSKLSLERFFTKEYQEKISQKYPGLIYVIDECQRYFHKRFYNKETFFYFQYHRHLGHDIYLLTQDSSLLPNEIRSLTENEIHAVRRSLSFFGEFKYNILCQKEIVDRKILKRDKSIFNLYKSMEQSETEKVKNPMIKYGIAILIAIIISVWGFKRTFLTHDKKEPEKAYAKTIDKSKPRKPKITPKNNTERIIPKANTKKKPVKLSHAMIGDQKLIIDPINNVLISPSQFKYPISWIIRNGKLQAWADIPQNEIPSNQTEPIKEKKILP